MSSVVIAGDSSGTVTLQAPATAGSTILTLPSTSGTVLTSASSVPATSITGTLPVVNGGTGQTSLSAVTVGTATNLASGSAGTIPYQTGSGATSMLAAGTSGYLLQSNGASAPSWVAPPASAGTVTAVASGALSDGSMVILNSDGTVSVGAATALNTFTQIANGSPAGANASGEYCTATTFGATDNRVVIFWIRSSDKYLMSTVGTVSGTTISFGTATVIYSAYCDYTYAHGLSAAYDPISNRYYCLYRQNSSSSGGVISVSVSTVTNSPTVVTNAAFAFASTSSDPSGYQIAIGGNKIVVAYVGNADNGQYVTVGTIAGASVTWGSTTANVIWSGNTYSSRLGVAFSADASEFVVGFSGTNGYVYVKRGTIAGSTVTFGSNVLVTSANGGSFPKCVVYASQQQKYFLMYGTNSNSVFGAVITSSGGSITSGTPATLGAGYASYFPYSLVYYATTGRVVGLPGYGVLIATLSGTTFSVYESGFPNVDSYSTAVFNSINDSIVTCGVGMQMYADTAYSTNITSINFLGVSNAAYSNGQTATIQTVGSTDDAQSGLTPGLKYYVGPGGSLTLGPSYPYAGLALTATKLVIKG